MIFIGRYQEAITHSSFVFEHKKKNVGSHNERLEFLGDSVLQLAVSDLLCSLFPKFSEGEMTRIRHQLVDNETLADIARSLHLGDVLRIGKGEEQAGARNRSRMLANGFEALLGAVYLELGYEASQEIIQFHFTKRAKRLAYQVPAKQKLMEWVQKRYKKTPSYQYIGHEGQAHQRTFFMQVLVNGEVIAQGKGRSKKEAQLDAAKEAIEKLGIL